MQTYLRRLPWILRVSEVLFEAGGSRPRERLCSFSQRVNVLISMWSIRHRLEMHSLKCYSIKFLEPLDVHLNLYNIDIQWWEVGMNSISNFETCTLEWRSQNYCLFDFVTETNHKKLKVFEKPERLKTFIAGTQKKYRKYKYYVYCILCYLQLRKIKKKPFSFPFPLKHRGLVVIADMA